MTTETPRIRSTDYFGFLTIIIEWLGAALCLYVHPVNLGEPFSQYGYYTDTKLLFGCFYVIAAVVYYLFAQNLDRYWRYTSLTALLGGVAFVVTGWHTYTPYAHTYTLDLHNIAITLAIIFYALPMLFISFNKHHHTIARFSRWLFTGMIFIALWSMLARIFNADFLFSQFIMVLAFHTWIAVVNYLHLHHARTAHLL